MKVAILFGPPGAGKGTQAHLISNNYDAIHFSTGNIIRAEITSGSPLGRQVKKLVEEGHFVDNTLLFQCINSYLDKIIKYHNEELKVSKDKKKKSLGEKYLILDGVPRNLEQVSLLETSLKEHGLSVNLVICMKVNFEALIKRFSMRWTCRDCHATYSFETSMDTQNFKCKACGALNSLYKRADDEEETAHRRYDLYVKATRPVISVYKEKGIVHNIDALGTVDGVHDEIVEILKKC
jgi:adenylate kinase